MRKFISFIIFVFFVFPIILPVFVIGWIWLCIKDGWRISRLGYQDFKDAGNE